MAVDLVTGVVSAESKTCPGCGFSGSEVEFVAFGILAEGVAIAHRDAAGEHGFQLVCGGCAVALGRLFPDALAEMVRDLGGEYL